MLQYLDLSFNRIGARGVMRICEVMKTSRFMRQLHLAHNRCGPAAGTPRHTPVLHLIPHQPLFPSSHPIHTHQPLLLPFICPSLFPPYRPPPLPLTIPISLCPPLFHPYFFVPSPTN